MFKITIPKPLYVSGNKLSNDLLAMLAPAGATVEFVADPVAQPGPVAQGADDVPNMPAEMPAAAEAPKPRGRPRKAAAETPPATQQTPAQAESAPTGAGKPDLVGGAPDREALLEEFTKLVDSDYDKAVEALTSFNVTKFSELTDEQLPAFAKAMR